MIARLRPLSVLCLAALLSACAGKQTAGLGELPGQPQGSSTAQLLQQAAQGKPEQAILLRLAAADQALAQRDLAQTQQILDLVGTDSLLPAQQIFASTLQAELALARNKPKAALQALQHPSFARLGELPLHQQARSQLARANALQADQQPLAAARERVFIAPLLEGQAAASNHEAIWSLVSGLSSTQLSSAEPAGDDLAGWLELAGLARSNATPAQQVARIGEWQAQHPQHPAAIQLPKALVALQEIAARPLTRIALLLPTQGPLASPAQALRDGFLAAHYQSGSEVHISLHDSSKLTNLNEFYRQAQTDGVQLVVGPLEKPLVGQLSQQEQLPIPTLALNYNESGAEGPAQLFQFGLAAEDEARAVAARAWQDGQRRAVAMVPSGAWGNRVLAAFRQDWEARGGSLIAAEHVDQPVRLAQQIADLLQLRASEARAKRLRETLGSEVEAQPARRQDVDFVFLAATPAQARQIKPTLAFQYAGDLPVYATSHLYSGSNEPSENLDLDGIRFCETPWLLGEPDPLREQVVGQWPAAAGSLGRLYAMGADAYRLAPRLGQLQTLPSARLEGLSGSLSLAPGQRIVRSLPWAEYRNGQIYRLETITQ